MSISAEGSSDSVKPSALEEADNRILSALQIEFPLCRSPYREIAKRTGLSEQEALERVRALRQRGLVRRIGGVINSQKLGLTGTLVAMKVPPERIDEVADTINVLPNVTHNYLRDHAYNMWFTITANSPQELAEIVKQIQKSTGITDLLDLPSLKTYKINVRLDFNKRCCTD